MPGEHAKDSPSGVFRSLLCPASRNRERDIPQEEGEESPAAREGTRAHQLLEHCLVEGVAPVLVHTLTDELGEWTVPEEMRRYIQEVLDYIDDRETRLVTRDNKPVVVKSEMRVDPADFTSVQDMHGTADVLIVSDNSLEVVDLKYGAGVKVAAKNNTQLVLYAAGAMAEYPTADFAEVRMTIAQPRIACAEGTVRTEVLSPMDIASMAAEIGMGVTLARSGLGPVIPGEVQCRWCRARASCKERADEVLTQAQVMFGPVEAATTEDMRDMLLDSVDTDTHALPADKLAAILDAIPALESYIKDMRTEAMKRMKSGSDVPGYKMVAGRRAKAWLMEEEDLKAKFKSMGIKVAQYNVTKMGSPAHLLKTVNKLTPARKEKFAKLWNWKEGNPTLAPESDEREALVIPSFEPVTNDETNEISFL